MTLARFNFAIQDDEGNVIDGATVTVTNELTGALAVPYSDAAGATRLGNPYTATDGSDAGFFAIGGFYRIDAVLGGLSRTWRYVAVGTAGATDTASGATRIVTAAGDITVAPTDSEIIVKKTVGAATNVTLGKAADRGGASITIKDGKGDADTHNITPVFDGSELCDGLAASSFVITTPYGWIKFKPLPDGTGWYTTGEGL